MKTRCPSCNCPLDIAESEGEFVCPGCGEILVLVIYGGVFSIHTLAEDGDPYESVSREWEKAVDAGNYERAERLRREMERMMGETSEEEEIEVVEDEEEGMEELLVKRGNDDEDFWDFEEDDGELEDEEDEEEF